MRPLEERWPGFAFHTRLLFKDTHTGEGGGVGGMVGWREGGMEGGWDGGRVGEHLSDDGSKCRRRKEAAYLGWQNTLGDDACVLVRVAG